MANMKVEVVSLVTTDSKQTNLENFLRYMDDALGKTALDLGNALLFKYVLKK